MTAESQNEKQTTTHPARSKWLRWTLILGIFAGVLTLVCGGLYRFLWLTPYGVPPFPIDVQIPQGTGLRDVAFRLERAGMLRSASAFVIFASLKGQQSQVQAGEYRFEGPVPPNLILERLVKGDVLLHRITIPEGWTVAQVAQILATKGLAKRERILELAADPDFTSRLLGFKAPSLEGFLFPETYHFPAGWDEERLLEAMVGRFQHAFSPKLQSRSRELNWTTLEAVTMASLIEKESAIPSERTLISGVFHRRLKLGMRLECDPSVIYGLSNFRGNIRRKDLSNPHPFNTYVVKGLPLGPICNPGLDSLVAALYPIDAGHLYFVSKNDGSHHFSRSYKEHLKAVARYQRGRR